MAVGGDCGCYPVVGAEGSKVAWKFRWAVHSPSVLTAPGNQCYKRERSRIPIFSNSFTQPQTDRLPAQTVCTRVF